jgi:dihydrolipoamide dehydrogenase
MKEYDAIVVGSGSGAMIVEQALVHNLSVALVDKGPLGGTCLNVGCIPSKMVIFSADRIMEIRDARRLDIQAEIQSIDFKGIMERMRRSIAESRSHMKEGIKHNPGLDFYEGVGSFTDDYTLEIGGERVKGKKIFLVSGARPLIPSVKGIDEIDYLTNESVLDLKERPESLIIVGGGYVAAEYAHFFSAVGTKVTVIQRAERLVKEEEPEISELLKKKMEEQMEVHTSTEAVEVIGEERGYKVIAEHRSSGERKEFRAEKILIAAGRKSNADLLKVKNTGVETDDRDYIKVNAYLETSKKNIWALGDAIGIKMYKHSANHQANLVWHNSMHGEKNKVDFTTVPHAVFSYPQIASVGLGEAEARENRDVLVGKAKYSDVAKGEAMRDEESFAKIIVEKETWKILGFHIIGPYAPILIQEVIDAIASVGTVMPLVSSMHIHPALPEVVKTAVYNLQ